MVKKGGILYYFCLCQQETILQKTWRSAERGRKASV